MMRPRHLITCSQKVTILLIQKLITKFYNYLYGFLAPIMKVFTKRILKYNLQNCRGTLLSNPKTKKCGTDTIAYKTAQLWSTLRTR